MSVHRRPSSRRRWAAASTAIWTLAAVSAAAAPRPSQRSLQTTLDRLRAELGFPGAAVALVSAGGDEVAVSTGLADLESGRRMRPRDAMLSGSAGKSFVAATVLRLAGEGRLALDEPVARWLGDEAWFARLPNARSITLRHLLAHRSGLPEYLESPALQARLAADPARAWTVSERLEGLSAKGARSRPGAGFHYADTNYILAGAVVERATGDTYEEALRPLLERAGLVSTRPADRPELRGLVQGYTVHIRRLGLWPLVREVRHRGRTLGSVVVDGRYVFNPQLEWTGGGLLTTAPDLARWAKALYSGKLLRADLLDQMLDVRSGSGRYGLGVQVGHTGHWGLGYGHGGWMPGYQSHLEYLPDLGLAIAVMLNTDDDSIVEARQVVFAVLRTLDG